MTLQHKFGRSERFSLNFKEEEFQKYPLDVEFRDRVKFFDIENIAHTNEYAKLSKVLLTNVF